MDACSALNRDNDVIESCMQSFVERVIPTRFAEMGHSNTCQFSRKVQPMADTKNLFTEYSEFPQFQLLIRLFELIYFLG